MKYERSTEEYGGGSGREIYSSEYFRVVKWQMSKGLKTSLTCNLIAHHQDIDFDGWDVDLDNDEKCMAQLTVPEIVLMIEYQKEQSFEKGQLSKMNEYRKLLGLDEKHWL